MIKRSYSVLGPGLMGAILLAMSSHAAGQAPSVGQPAGINLGSTSFYDGFSGTPGWSWLTTARYSSYDRIKDGKGNDVAAFQDVDIESFAWVNQIAYSSTTSHGGWRPGFTAIVPVVALNSSFGAGPSLLDGGTGFGDIAVGVFLQSDPVINREGRPIFVQRISLDALLPIGKYDRRTDINQGAGFASFNPYWAATLFPAENWEMSWRLHYLYNFKNEKPATSNPLPFNGQAVTRTQAGQATWLNFAASYSVTPKISAGINGYYFKQLSDSKANGTPLPDARERVLGIGPGVMWRIDPKKSLWLNAYRETMVRGRPSAPLRLQLRLAVGF